MNHKTCAVIGLLVATTTLVGCASIASIERMQLTVKDYAAAAPRVNLGMTKGQVGEILQPTQHSGTRYPEMYTKDGAVVEILYFRSGWQNDHHTTDAEFTPYVFKDGKLVAVGWVTLGGPRSQVQARTEKNENFNIMFLPISD